MIVLLSGEGPSDLGQCNNQQGECRVPNFEPGPMTVLVDQILASQLRYSLLQDTPDRYLFCSEHALEQKAQARKREQRRTSLIGKKRPEQETGYFYINAWMLGEIAKGVEEDKKDTSIAVLFRDCDGTRSAKAALYEAKRKSIEDGFLRAEYPRGVPMLPKPKSEAWLLCAAKRDPYQHCAALEELSGNDASPNSAKDQLNQALKAKTSAQELRTWLEKNPYDFGHAAKQMPSMAQFVARLKEVISALSICNTGLRRQSRTSTSVGD